MEGDEEEMAIAFITQANAHMMRMIRLISQATSLNTDSRGQGGFSDDSTEDGEGPGRGNTVDGAAKATYYRRGNTSFYQLVREIDADVTMFTTITHLSRQEFDSVLSFVAPELQKPMDVRQTFPQSIQSQRLPRKRILNCEEMLFFLFDTMSGGNEGGVGCKRFGLKYGLSVGTVSNYFRHSLNSLYMGLTAVDPPLIRWPSAEEREEMEGLIIGFPKCVFLVDGNKNKRWRPRDSWEQEHAYDGYKHTHAFSIVAFCDIYGNFIRLEITDKGAESDRNLYTGSEVYRNPTGYLCPGQHGMADMGFGGDGELVVPYKRNESTEWMYRGEHNRDIRKQRMVNEWGLGFINNRYRLSLGRWPFDADLFPMPTNLLRCWPTGSSGTTDTRTSRGLDMKPNLHALNDLMRVKAGRALRAPRLSSDSGQSPSLARSARARSASGSLRSLAADFALAARKPLGQPQDSSSYFLPSSPVVLFSFWLYLSFLEIDCDFSKDSSSSKDWVCSDAGIGVVGCITLKLYLCAYNARNDPNCSRCLAAIEKLAAAAFAVIVCALTF